MAFKLTILQALTLALGFGIAYFVNKSALKWWRVLVGFIVGFILSWIVGVIVWAYLFMSHNIPFAIGEYGMPRSFLFAVAGAGLGVFFGRRIASANSAKENMKSEDGSCGQSGDSIDESVYAEVSNELETGNIDKGLWTRLIAECDGNEGITRVAYIKERARRLQQCSDEK